MKWLKSTYRTIVDHLTKALGVLGMAVMAAFAAINPEQVMAAAQTYSAYLGSNAVAKIGIGMFGLVTARGWYTGYKATLAAAEHARLLQDHIALQAQFSDLRAQLESIKGQIPQAGTGSPSGVAA